MLIEEKNFKVINFKTTLNVVCGTRDDKKACAKIVRKFIETTKNEIAEGLRKALKSSGLEARRTGQKHYGGGNERQYFIHSQEEIRTIQRIGREKLVKKTVAKILSKIEFPCLIWA